MSASPPPGAVHDPALTPRPRVEREPFGASPDGRPVDLFTLENGRGVRVRFIGYGGIVVSLEVPDRHGASDDVTLGYDTLDAYLAENPYFGTLIGRYANRIGGARFTLDGRSYRLPPNDGPNQLHGGRHGFHTVLWIVEPFRREDEVGAVLTYTSADGEEGFPGTLAARVTYTLTAGDELIFDYHATTDRPTPVGLTQHSYFNLAGDGRRDVLDHLLTIDASRFTPVGAALIPTGELRSVAGTPFDFTTPARIGERIDRDDAQLRIGGGYDHNFVLDRAADGTLARAARLEDPGSGRVLEILTTEPGIQLYSGNSLDGRLAGKRGRRYYRHYGVALETQHFPDSPNRPAFPSTILRPGEEYRSRTVYRFSVRR